jgi:glycosyltransferase involved in cell wall biosynthesis
MTVTIITVSFNSAKTISDTLQSIALQTYPKIEHIIIDGASKDHTLDIIRQFPHVAKVISEPDKGIYDAMNKGINMATGDIIGILNSDDFYGATDLIQKVVDAFEQQQIDAVFGDVTFVQPNNLKKVVRYYSSKRFHPKKFEFGYMPAHPTFFTKKETYEKYGMFKTNYHISADYELLIRLLYVHKLKYHYLNYSMVTMRAGGVSNSSLKHIYILNKEIVRACEENGIKTNMFKLSLKFFRKISEFIFVKP